MRITMFCLNTVAKVEVESSRLRGQVEALEAGGKDRSKRGLQAPTPPILGNVALRFDLLSARFSATLAHPCKWLLQSARLKAEKEVGGSRLILSCLAG
jgi:hypothetical protein